MGQKFSAAPGGDFKGTAAFGEESEDEIEVDDTHLTEQQNILDVKILSGELDSPAIQHLLSNMGY